MSLAGVEIVVALTGAGVVSMGAEELVDDSPVHDGRDRVGGFTRYFDEMALLPTFPFSVEAAEGTGWILASESESISTTSWGRFGRRTAIFRFLGGSGFEPFVRASSASSASSNFRFKLRLLRNDGSRPYSRSLVNSCYETERMNYSRASRPEARG